MHEDECYECDLTPAYNPPIIAFSEELYTLMSDKDEISFDVYDSGVAPDDIIASFGRNLENIKFAVITDINCSQTHAKTDAIIWKLTVRFELITTYRGRLKVADMIQEVGNTLTRTEHIFSCNMMEKGYTVVRMNIGEAVIGSASRSGGLTWQNGNLTVDYWLSQIDNF